MCLRTVKTHVTTMVTLTFLTYLEIRNMICEYLPIGPTLGFVMTQVLIRESGFTLLVGASTKFEGFNPYCPSFRCSDVINPLKLRL